MDQLYHEERNRDYAVSGGTKQSTGNRVPRSDPMDVSSVDLATTGGLEAGPEPTTEDSEFHLGGDAEGKGTRPGAARHQEKEQALTSSTSVAEKAIMDATTTREAACLTPSVTRA